MTKKLRTGTRKELCEVHRIPVLSTKHLDKATCARLDKDRNDSPWCVCVEWEYGYFLHFFHPDMPVEKEPLPKCLQDLRKWLEDNGFTDRWVRLDTHALVQPELPIYHP